MKNGANVQIYTANYGDAQHYVVSIRSNGTVRILSRLSGKSIDIKGGTITQNQNVQQYNSNNSRAQSWLVETDGNNATFKGVTYPTYTIKVASSTGYALDVEGGTMANRSNVRIHSANGSEAQRWMFVPMPEFTSGGTYELRSLLKTSMAVDVEGASDIRGANVQLWNANGSNAQKFYLVEEENDHWSIQNVKSGMFVDVVGGSTRSGTNVQQYTDNDSRAQRWRVTQYGTTTLNGKTCAVVTLGSWVTGDGQTLNMDVYNALTSNRTNIDIVTATGETKQRFILYPTTPQDPTLPVPTNVSWCKAVGDTDWSQEQLEQERLYPCWQTTTAWATDTAGHYEWRWRMRHMDGASGAWEDFGDFNEWQPVAATVDGQRVWVTDGLSGTIADEYRAMQYELQVRSAAPTADGNLNVGAANDVTLTAWPVTAITTGNTGFSPDGLRIDYESDYLHGTTDVRLTSLTNASTGEELLSRPVIFNALDSDGSLLVPTSSLKRWVDDGEQLVAQVSVGNDMTPNVLNEQTIALDAVEYGTSSGMEVTPTIGVGEGRTLEVTVPSGYNSKVWAVIDGELRPMAVKDGKATLLYPFGASCEVYVTATNEAGDQWGVWHQSVYGLGNARPCHAWNWSGGSFLLEYREGSPMETDYTVDRQVGTYSLDSRKWQSVHYGPTSEGTFSAVGALSPYIGSEWTREGLAKLCEQGYATYRSPSGMVCDVAVLGYHIVENRRWTEVTVSMRRVTN